MEAGKFTRTRGLFLKVQPQNPGPGAGEQPAKLHQDLQGLLWALLSVTLVGAPGVRMAQHLQGHWRAPPPNLFLLSVITLDAEPSVRQEGAA